MVEGYVCGFVGETGVGAKKFGFLLTQVVIVLSSMWFPNKTPCGGILAFWRNALRGSGLHWSLITRFFGIGVYRQHTRNGRLSERSGKC